MDAASYWDGCKLILKLPLLEVIITFSVASKKWCIYITSINKTITLGNKDAMYTLGVEYYKYRYEYLH